MTFIVELAFGMMNFNNGFGKRTQVLVATLKLKNQKQAIVLKGSV
jgi:hypothetical protein